MIAAFLEPEGQIFQLAQNFLCFLDKGFNGLLNHSLYPKSFLVTAMSLSASKGLFIHPVAPAAFPFAFMSGADSVVSMTIGIPLPAAS